MFCRKYRKLFLTLAGSGCFFAFSSSVFAMGESPYVGNSQRATENESIAAESQLIAERSQHTLTINPYPVAPETQEKKAVAPQAQQADFPAIPSKQEEDSWVVQEPASPASSPDTFDVKVERQGGDDMFVDVTVPQDPDLLVLPPPAQEKRVIGQGGQGTVPIQEVAPMPAPARVPEAVAAGERPIPAETVECEVWKPDSAPQKITRDAQPPEDNVHYVEPYYVSRTGAYQPQSVEETGGMSERINWRTPPSRWRALRGTALHDLLAAWGREGGMRVIWDTNRSFIVKETFSIKSSYEEAVFQVLSQYENDPVRPFGKVYSDPDSGRPVLVIRSVD